MIVLIREKMEILGLIDIPASALLAVCFVSLIYWYINRDFNYWKSRGVPHPKPWPLVGTMGGFLFTSFYREEMKRFKTYGKVYGGYDGHTPFLSVGDPNLLKNIMVKDFHIFTDRRILTSGNALIDNMLILLQGKEWKNVRTVITPVFTSGKLKRLHGIIEDSTATICNHFMQLAKRGAPIECTKLFGAFSMDVILSTAFGTKVDSLTDEDNLVVKMSRNLFRKSWRLYLAFHMPTLARILKIAPFSVESAEYLKEITLQMIKERRVGEKKRDDFLQLLIDVEAEVDSQEGKDMKNGAANKEEFNGEAFKQSALPKKLTPDEIVAQCILFLAAGYDTTSTTLSFTAYCLALNPDCQEKLINEIDAAFRDNEKIDYDVIQNMKYLDCVINETLRIYPALLRVDRRASEDYKLGDTGIVIPKGMVVCIPIETIHHDPDLYPDPEAFKPERFSPQNKADISHYSYLPFGTGPRNCIGMRFALMEMKICVFNLFRRFRFKPCKETTIPPESLTGNLLMAPKSIALKVEVREHASVG